MNKNFLIILVAAAAAGITWIINNSTPAGFAAWIILLPLLALFARRLSPFQVLFTAALFGVVILGGYWTRPDSLPVHFGLTNRILGVAAVAVLAWRIIRHKQADEAFREMDSNYRSLVERSPFGSYILQGDRLVYVNDSFCQMMGYSKEELFEKDVLYLAHPDDHALAAEIVSRIKSGEMQELNVELKGMRKNGEEFYFHITGHAGHYNGRPAFLGKAFDITERKKLELARQDFISMLTHDLKSPLTAIMGYSDLLGSVCVHEGAEAREMVEAIQRSSEKMLGMIEGFLLVSKLEAGKMKVTRTVVDFSKTVRELTGVYSRAAKGKGLDFETEITDSREAFIDEKNMERAVSNLLENAFKFTSAGGRVLLRTESGKRESGGKRTHEKYIAISVHDTGPGIPEEEKEKIFDKYYRSNRTAGMKGSGLGLAVVKAVTEAHGGRIDVRSEIGKGSSFTLFIPNDIGMEN